MKQPLIELIEPEESIRSKMKFQGDFHQELAKLMEKAEEVILKQIISKYGVEYTEYSKASLKVKIKDKILLTEKLIVCNFVYRKNDVRYGYIIPQFRVTEKSKKTQIYDLEKFTITEHKDIIKAFIDKLIDIIEEY